MSHPIAETIIAIAVVYAVLGLLFALAFALFGWRRVQTSEPTGTIGFRISLLPGATLLWPWLLARWISGRRQTKADAR